MNLLYSIVIACVMLFFSLPLIKFYQLKGYDVKKYFENLFEIKLSLCGKNKLKWTKRIVRFSILFCVIEVLLWYIVLQIIPFWWIILLDLLTNFIFLPIYLPILHYFLFPVESLIKKMYIKKTRNKLKEFKGLKIAITGSYGKTSTKNILSELLSMRYRVVSSPQNYNTTMGLCRTVLQHLKNDTEVLIVECGARHRGDIREICDILKPDIAIITSVGEQHLETFGSLENVMSTKFELCESLSQNGICFFDGYDENAMSLYKKASCKKNALGLDVQINVKRVDGRGASFDMIGEGIHYSLKTKLLGRFLIRDVALAVMVCKHLNLTRREIEVL